MLGYAKTCVVSLNPNFQVDDWKVFEQFYTSRVKEVSQWDLDLRRLTFMNSMLMGLIVGLNAVVNNNQGQLRLVVARNSKIGELLHQAKVDRILTITEK